MTTIPMMPMMMTIVMVICHRFVPTMTVVVYDLNGPVNGPIRMVLSESDFKHDTAKGRKLLSTPVRSPLQGYSLTKQWDWGPLSKLTNTIWWTLKKVTRILPCIDPTVTSFQRQLFADRCLSNLTYLLISDFQKLTSQGFWSIDGYRVLIRSMNWIVWPSPTGCHPYYMYMYMVHGHILVGLMYWAQELQGGLTSVY